MGRYLKEGFLVIVGIPGLAFIPFAILLFLMWVFLPDERSRAMDFTMSAFMLGFSALVGALLVFVSPTMAEVAVNDDAQDAKWWHIDRRRVPMALALGLIFALGQRGGILLIDQLAGPRTPLAHGLKYGGYLLLGALGLSLATTLWGHYVEGRPLR